MSCNENLKKIQGTVAYTLNRRIKEVESLMASPRTFLQLKDKVEDILKDPEITTESGRQKAIKTLRNAKSYSQYLSTLGTWLSGITC